MPVSVYPAEDWAPLCATGTAATARPRQARPPQQVDIICSGVTSDKHNNPYLHYVDLLEG